MLIYLENTDRLYRYTDHLIKNVFLHRTNNDDLPNHLVNDFQIVMFSLFQYIHPGDAHKLGQAELVCIDEAAAIPLPLVKNLLGPYLVFMSSTVNGYVNHFDIVYVMYQCTLVCSVSQAAVGVAV